MGILPHKDVGRALELAFSLDIPFFPQLPRRSFYEDMYVQLSSNFPGISLDLDEKKINFSHEKFLSELDKYFEADDDFFRLRYPYSEVYEDFLGRDLSGFYAVRGQVTGPVSFGFRVFDEEGKPIIYHDDVREILFDFVVRKVNVMLEELKEKNENAFVWVDEPGLGWVFSAFSGYNDEMAREDLRSFFSRFYGIKGLHLCADVNLPYLLDLGIELLSFDSLQIGELHPEYGERVADFIRGGGVIAWGIVPTDPSLLKEDAKSLARRLLSYWDVIEGAGMPKEEVARNSLLAPSRCCVSISEGGFDEEGMVERAFKVLRELSYILREDIGI